MLNSFSKLESSKVYKSWKKKNKDSFLCSCFFTDDENNWQFDFYLPKKDMIKTFVVEDLNIKELADSRIFRNDKSNMKVLNLDDVKIDFDEALKIMDNIKNQKYKSENVLRKIVVLQYIKRQLWNMTFLMSSLNLLNVRIDSESGKVLSENVENIMKFKAS
ncbi:hypothetical protein J4214_02405 [Candidatus Woesearchaeota archaeon]|nr:hypothetical protein [Candidatus Woesearchaeota archaeon]